MHENRWRLSTLVLSVILLMIPLTGNTMSVPAGFNNCASVGIVSHYDPPVILDQNDKYNSHTLDFELDAILGESEADIFHNDIVLGEMNLETADVALYANEEVGWRYIF